MPMSDEHALRQFEIEALQRINDNLRLLNNGQAEMVKGMHAIDLRLTRIESNSVSADVAEVKLEVERLKADRLRREGALGVGAWIVRYFPQLLVIAGFAALMIVVLIANDKLSI